MLVCRPKSIRFNVLHCYACVCHSSNKFNQPVKIKEGFAAANVNGAAATFTQQTAYFLGCVFRYVAAASLRGAGIQAMTARRRALIVRHYTAVMQPLDSSHMLTLYYS
jgi:hypothetical protein